MFTRVTRRTQLRAFRCDSSRSDAHERETSVRRSAKMLGDWNVSPEAPAAAEDRILEKKTPPIVADFHELKNLRGLARSAGELRTRFPLLSSARVWPVGKKTVPDPCFPVGRGLIRACDPEDSRNNSGRLEKFGQQWQRWRTKGKASGTMCESSYPTELAKESERGTRQQRQTFPKTNSHWQS